MVLEWDENFKVSRIPFITRILKNRDFTTKAYVYFSNKTAGDDYDPYEKNWTYSNNNPKVIKGYVTQLSVDSLVWKPYGLKEQGAVEFFCDSRYIAWFEKCNKIEIDGEEFQVFKEGTGGRSIITKRPYNIIRVLLEKK